MRHTTKDGMRLTRRDAVSGLAAVSVLTVLGRPCGVVLGAVRLRTGDHHEAWRGALAEHRIERIEHRVVQNRWPRLVGRNARLGVHGWGGADAVAVVHTDRGATGWGLAYGMSEGRAHELTARYTGLGLDEVFEPDVGVAAGVPTQLDFALHDLAGVVLDVPVYEMLGALGPAATPCYSGMIYFDDLEPLETPPGIEQVLYNAGADRAFGYRQMKIKVGRGNRWMEHDAGLARDIEVTRALAAAYPDVTFLADANDGYSVSDTTAYLDGIGDVDLLFMEEPFRESEAGFAELRAYLDASGSRTLIADGEADPDAALLDRLIERGLFDVHLSDVYGLGFTAWRRLLPSLAARGVPASPHTWGSRLKTVYVSHLAVGFGNVLTIEGVTAFSRDVDYAAYDLDEAGCVSPPALPGFGLRLR